MRYARRVDSNLSDIVDIARKMGFRVHITNADWDITAQLGGRTELWECKRAKKASPITARQARLKEQGFSIRTVRTEQDVRAARWAMMHEEEIPF